MLYMPSIHDGTPEIHRSESDIRKGVQALATVRMIYLVVLPAEACALTLNLFLMHALCANVSNAQILRGGHKRYMTRKSSSVRALCGDDDG